MNSIIDKIIHVLRLRNLWFQVKFLFLKEKYEPKVFCIGFNKTGTTSLGRAFELLGLRNLTYNKNVHDLYDQDDMKKIIKYAAKYDSFDDIPWHMNNVIELMDKTFPGSKFVHLEREEEAWKKSHIIWHEHLNMENDIDVSVRNYRRHNEFVRSYFKNREGSDFMIFDIKDPEGFKKLSQFLNKPYIQDGFPHLNKAAK